jgi:autotransporter strand-loop-strand O-heptosyltransferase
MKKFRIYGHGSYIGNTGYNQHTRDFFRELSKHCQIKFRNFTIGESWKGYNSTPHDNEPYINETDKLLLYQQILWNNDNTRSDYDIYPSREKDFQTDLNLILCETNHHIFYDSYLGPKIAYNVWESTLQPFNFFNKLKEFDEVWVPSEWQKTCMIKQGYPKNKIEIVPEGVDDKTFFPEKLFNPLTNDGRFKFFLAGRWDYRKSTKEIIETFLKTFDKNEPVDLIVSIDNPFSNDGLSSTEERLEKFGFTDERIKVLHFPKREDYVSLLKSVNCFVSCARSEGWNLPLIESMACGTPSIYSNCSGQLEFAKNKGIPVNIIGEKPVTNADYNHFNENVGNYYEPDFNHLSEKMRFVYEFYEQVKETSLQESVDIRNKFCWEQIAKIGYEKIVNFFEKNQFDKNPNTINVSFLDGPRVEINGHIPQDYHIEFIDSRNDEIKHSSSINTNMWIACGIKYFIPWKIKVNGEVIYDLNLEGKKVLISMESKSLGDTIAWAPYSVEFQKKYKCEVILSSFHNSFFENYNEYKNIKFIEPGQSVVCDVVYRLGWFRKDNLWNDTDRNPNQVNLIPLQKTACDILGLDFKEINYGINFTKRNNPLDKKYFVFGPTATSGCKEWVYENWVQLSKMIKNVGYEIVILSQKPFHIENTLNVWGESLDVVCNYLYHAEGFIGLGSGLSWLNWALGKHTHMINGFSKNGHEFTTNITRIFQPNVCINCWNNESYVFDAGDWNWCPIYKGTEKQHICQKSISPIQVFNVLGIKQKKELLYPKNDSELIQNFIKEIYEDNEYNRFGIKIEYGDVVLDAGGNVGVFSNYAFDMGASKVFSYEIDSNLFEFLNKNTSGLSVVNKLEKVSGYDSNIDKILKDNNLKEFDFAKIDIEGDEWSLFEKISENEIKSVKKWAIEFHTSYFNQSMSETTKKETLWAFLKIIEKFNLVGYQTYFEHIHKDWDVIHLFCKKIVYE